MTITTLRNLDETTARDVRDDFYERGFDLPAASWTVGLRFALAYGLVNSSLEPVNRAAEKILAVCKKEFLKGQKQRLEIAK